MARRMNEGKETWHRLLEWDRGQAPAERLAAILLHNDGFQNVDPSHPLGGKDGKKDIVFFEKESKWIAGIYFPRGQKTFKDIKDKFIDDFGGVTTNQASGFVFITNQELRLAERQELCEVDTSINIVIYHLERIATMLNTPVNYGVRLEFLDIEMTKEEQLSFFAGISSLPISQKKPDISLKGVLENKPVSSAHAYTRNWTDSCLLRKKEQKIREIYEQVKKIRVSEKDKVEFSESKVVDIQDDDSSLSKYIGSEEMIAFKERMSKIDLSGLVSVKDVEISSDIQKTITEYCEKKGLLICNNFFVLGNLKKSISTIVLPFGNSKPSLEGTDEEQAKYNKLIELYWEIDEYNEYYDYFFALQEKYYVKCVISNTGTSFDEDIDVKMIFPRGCICYSKNLPIPGYSFIKMFNENSLEEKLFMMEPVVDIDGFSNYPPAYSYHMPDINMTILMQGKSVSEKYEEYKEIYYDAMDQLFCYTVYSDTNHDVFSFNIPYLKQNTNMGFPTILVFNSLPQEVEFEIRSKHLSDVVIGSMKIIEHD